jgi:hypothetical protein
VHEVERGIVTPPELAFQPRQAVVGDVIEIGRRLTLCKAKCGHGRCGWNRAFRRRFIFQSVSHLREADRMPWTPNDAERHTHKAATPALKELWAEVANEALKRTGDEGRAIREANAVIARQTEHG